MADAKGSSQSRDAVFRRAEAPTTANSSTQQSVQERSSAATQYWQRVAAAGRAAKPAEEARSRQMPAQRPSARAKP
jgi:hypothetical protein